ncbi:MAG: TonB-dependent receptor [Gemmatimonadetes bacterium]|nr:TonB-dependent receptor [Gemmatimonadota bacterium]
MSSSRRSRRTSLARVAVSALLAALLALPAAGHAQQNTVSGTVVAAATGAPLEGVAVGVVGTTAGTRTNAAGRYSVSAPANGSLAFSRIGYTATQVNIAGRSTVDVRLQASVAVLDELVVTGYQTQRRADITTAVATVNVEAVERQTSSSVLQRLAGAVPGVTVETSGSPGARSTVRIRGVSSFQNNNPLYIIDGTPVEEQFANFLNPHDVESIQVLKDASAASIYGARATNGVVIITTRKGRASGSPQVAINAYTGTQRPDWSTFPALADANEFATFMLRRARQRAMAGAPQEGGADSLEFRRQLAGQQGPGTDWFRAVTQNAPMSEVNASISGGTERIRAYFSGGFLNQDGIVINSGYSRASLRANLDAALNDRVSIGFNLAPTYSTFNGVTTGGINRAGGFGQSIVVWPLDYPVDPRTDTINHLVRGATTVGRGTANPVEILRNQERNQRTLRMLGTTFLNFELLDGLAFRTSLNGDLSNTNVNTFNPSSIWNSSGPTIPSGANQTTGYLSWLNENTLTLDRFFGEAHRVQAVAGFTAQEEKERALTTSGSQFPDDDIRTLNAANIVSVGGIEEEGWSLASVLGRVNYTLLDRYVLTATMRSDGSSRFGQNRRWGSFPSAAVAWNVSREPFMENAALVQDLKLRASLGYTGNNQIGNYPSLGIVNRDDYIFGGNQRAGRRLTTLQNPELGWEKTREVNLGLDASFLDRRAALTLDAYRRNTTNLLLALELPTASGFGSVIANQGEIQNDGFEVGLNTSNIDTRRFRWTSNLNLSVNRNKALDLGASDTLHSGSSMEGNPTHISVVGQPIARFFGYKLLGVYSPQDIANACVPNAVRAGCVPIFGGARPTDPKFADINGDGVITPRADFTVIGTPNPDFTWGMTHTLSYGPVDLRFTVDGAVGGQRLSRTLASTENIDGIFNVTKDYVQNMWISPDSSGYDNPNLLPSAGFSSGEGRRRFRDVHDRWAMDAGYVWMRNINLRYSLPSSMMFNARSGSVYLSIQNPKIWSEFRGNPQTQTQNILGGSSPNLTPGVDEFSYPIARTFTLGVDLAL